MSLVYKTSSNIEIFCFQGKKSQYDYIVRYKEPNKRVRTPKHIHWIIDLYIKRENNLILTMQFVDYLIHIATNVVANSPNTPTLQFFNKDYILQHFGCLNNFGEYSIEFLAVVVELLMIQEKTNYPNGTLQLDILKAFKSSQDIFTIVQKATFR